MSTLTIKNRNMDYTCINFSFLYTGTNLSESGSVTYITCGDFEMTQGFDFDTFPEEPVYLDICARSIVSTSFVKDMTDYENETSCNF